MKMASLVVSLLGVLALVLGVVEWLCPSVQILHLTPSGYLRGATALLPARHRHHAVWPDLLLLRKAGSRLRAKGLTQRERGPGSAGSRQPPGRKPHAPRRRLRSFSP